MKELLEKLHFRYVPQENTDAWVKTYRRFKLWIAYHSKGIYVSSIEVLNIEVSLPALEHEQMMKWVEIFDKENTL